MADDVTKFETTLKERRVTIDDKLYVIKELDGRGLSASRGVLDNAEVSVHPDGTSTFKNMSLQDQEINLLSMCLYDEQGKLVPKPVMQSWPSNVLTGLFNMAQELSGLNEEGRNKQKAEAKNS